MNAKDARRTDRVSLYLPIRVSGVDVTGQKFDDEARTISISRHGATIVLARKLAPGQCTRIRNLSTRQETAVRVVGQIGGQPHGNVYGITLVDSSEDIWKIRFPPLSESEKAVMRLLLECIVCQTREVAYLNELEVEVLEANTNLSRSCQNCNDWTVWKQAPLESKSTPDHLGAAHQPLESSSSPHPRPRNRRKNVRVTLKKITACIRQAGLGEEIVQVDDLSRDGLRFRSSKTYYEGSKIEVAVPYEPRGANIFVLARIVRFRDLPEPNFKEYGVAYLLKA